MTMTLNRRYCAPAAVAVALALLLSACMPGTPVPVAPATVEPTPTETAEPVATAPEPRMNLTCDEIASPASASAVLSEPVTVRSAAATKLGAYPEMPSLFHVRTLGGLVCEWSNGVPESSSRGYAPGYVGASVSILPEADAQWARFVSYYGVVDDRQLYCFSSTTVDCYLDTLINGYWVEARIQGLNVDPTLDESGLLAGAAPFFDRLIAAVEGTGAPGPRWTPPADTLALPTDCDAYIGVAEVQSILGISDPLENSSGGGGGWSQGGGAVEDSSAGGCGWFFVGEDRLAGGIASLPGGAWAAAEARAAGVAPYAPEDLVLTGLVEGETAYIRCTPGDQECYVDITIGGNWVQLVVYAEESGGALASVNRRTGVTAIAESVLARLRP